MLWLTFSSTEPATLRALNSGGISASCMVFENGGQIIGVTKASILMFSFTAFKVNVTTSYVFVVLLVVPKVLMSIVSFWMDFSCSLFLKSSVINVFCDPVSMRMRAWRRFVGPLADTIAVCSSAFVRVVVVVARVVDAGLTLLFLLYDSCCGGVYRHSICMVLNAVCRTCWEVFVEAVVFAGNVSVKRQQ